MVNQWNYNGLGQVKYGALSSYQKSCEWLDEIGGEIEDWGCGCAFAKQFFTKSRYKGIDGSANPYADVCGVDLSDYKSSCDGILVRHVLDHNLNWSTILNNAIASFKRRMALIFFIDFGPETKVLSISNSPLYPGVPDIQFKKDDILKFIGGMVIKEEKIPDGALVDTIFYLQK